MILMTEKYYALYDIQLGGFKAWCASTDYQEVVQAGVYRAWELSQSDKEPCDDNMSDEDILKIYGYEVREVSKDDYEKILESDEHGLLTTVDI